jgi:hypothetical protein
MICSSEQSLTSVKKTIVKKKKINRIVFSLYKEWIDLYTMLSQLCTKFVVCQVLRYWADNIMSSQEQRSSFLSVADQEISKRGSPLLKGKSRILGLRSWVLLTFDGKFRAKGGGGLPLKIRHCLSIGWPSVQFNVCQSRNIYVSGQSKGTPILCRLYIGLFLCLWPFDLKINRGHLSWPSRGHLLSWPSLMLVKPNGLEILIRQYISNHCIWSWHQNQPYNMAA